MTEPESHQPQDHAGVASAEQGVVVLDGPNGVAVSMTPRAAHATGHSLIAAAEEATTQRGSETDPN